MTKIDKLIKDKCPNGVKYKKLKEICIDNFWVMPSTPKYQQEGIPYITSKNIRKGQLFFDNIKYITKEDFCSISNNRPIKENDFLISMIGTIGEVGIVKKEDLPLYGQNMYLLRLNFKVINLRFFYHYFTSSIVRNKLLGEKNNGNQGYLKTKNIESLLIPIPSLEVQEEIAKILDKFSELEAELEAELEERKNQYKFWCDKIYKEASEKYSNIKIGEIATVQRGGNFQKKDYVENGKPCIHYGQIYMHYGTYAKNVISYIDENVFSKQKIAHKNDVIMAVTSENIEDVCKSVAWIGEEEIAVSGHSAIISSNQNPKYLSYYFQSSLFQNEKRKFARGVKVVEFQVDKLKNITIPLPPLDEQERIVNILDKFDKLINDISEGIPAEIQLRKKQYEYYRNKLLSFEEVII